MISGYQNGSLSTAIFGCVVVAAVVATSEKAVPLSPPISKLAVDPFNTHYLLQGGSMTETSDGINIHGSLVTVRFYLVRHGETAANSEGLVVGQWDSPLSERGKEQANALGASEMMRTTKFWRKYSSDLGRTQATAQRIHRNSEDWILDSRIREIAKGARQEYPKSWEYERAVQERMKAGKKLPPLEMSEDAWRRIADFFATVLMDANLEFRTNAEAVTVNVLVVSHAGALRILLQKVASYAHPSLQHEDDPSLPPDDRKRLEIPNTSVTILEMTPKPRFLQLVDCKRPRRGRLGRDDFFFFNSTSCDGDENDSPDVSPDPFQNLCDSRVVEFLLTKHLDATVITSNDE